MTEFEARHTTLALLKTHGRGDWRVTINKRLRSRAGQCNYRMKTIELSAWLLRCNDNAAVMNTITHEVAHAIVGGWVGHGLEWRMCHRRLGGNGKRCYTQGVDLINDHERKRQKRNWIGTCPTCGKVYTRVRITIRPGVFYRCPRDKTRLTWLNEKTGQRG
jgi:predicted SprT family Zn-dependent metalloprotease